ncbi:hypothetical protein BST81_07690 [Leptolyngbya sp. 'hensonii']|uniref:serine/threonine-protein kinase n=1 Tax=Leptolyngbya sp. 'hensonii' TaxID=1922337 RepID=UPI00095024C3|nr:serine/threonine-protein kinase [Leptolyngbya sp. 'hensonii']OLP19085.1 hypothetical protein BST81_07690 [Leptolyngbya sp. 'hensonii']
MERILAGHYQIVRPLGGGGFGQTYLATDSHLPGSPLCVVKQLKPKVNDPETLQTAKRLFNLEAETLYNLGIHDQIPRLLAHFEQEDEFYLVQEYIEGHGLDQEIAPGKQLSELIVLDLLQDILQVLSFVHQNNVIHRDIKPANLIRRNRDHRIVLIDFGAVKEVSSQAAHIHGQTNLTVAIGSPGYMPSEQQAFHPQFSSDIYAVGMLCLQALSGLSLKELPRDSRTGEFSCTFMPDRISITSGLTSILDRMIRYDYRQRYDNAMEALKAVQDLISHENYATAILPPTIPTSKPGNYAPPHSTPQEATPPGKTTGVVSGSGLGGTDPSQIATDLRNLSADQRKNLERLLGEVFGPIAGVILKKALTTAPSIQDLVEQLVASLPPKDQPRFREQTLRLLTQAPDTGSATKVQYNQATRIPTGTSGASGTSTATTDPIDPNFVKRCEQELARLIGPIAPLIVQRTVAQQPNLSRSQLVELLNQHLPDLKKKEELRQVLLITS